MQTHTHKKNKQKDIESYSLFAKLFDPCIDEYHGGFKPTAKHPSDPMDASKLKGVLFFYFFF